jgi:O-succinylbenzoic acid--CoA ligase
MNRRIAVATNNSPELVDAIRAAMQGGDELVLQNTRLTERERAAQLDSIARVPVGPAGATILFTSGTTGTAKAVRLTRENHLASARASAEVLRIDASSRYVCCLPLFHVGGLGIVFRCECTGARLLLHERFDAAAVARELRDGATHVSLVAATLSRVLDQGQRFPPAIVAVGGGPVPAQLLQRARGAGLRVVQTWGMTETASMATCERPDDADGMTAGPPLPGFEVRVESGEILVRGPAVIQGYLGAAPVGAWFRTGDLGDLDPSGRLIVHARRTDLILRGGENVYPAEIEAALLSHPAVREVAVLPSPDETWGQVPVAYVTSEASEGELREFLRGRIAGYKVPARFIRVAELPRTGAGKVDRLTLLGRASPEMT